jgi:hypothetical protein
MSLPPCPARRLLEGEAGFYCAHPRMHAPDQRVSVEICLVCPYPAQPPPSVFRPFPPPAPRGRCGYLGGFSGWRECPTCGGSVRVKVFACSHARHLETTLRECEVCPDYDEPGGQRNAPAAEPPEPDRRDFDPLVRF